jgi:glycosyltransferase involved in cell wall biosynthesis
MVTLKKNPESRWGPVRIVVVLNSLAMGGAEKLALAVAERLASRGHTAVILTLKPRLAEQLRTPVPVVHLNLSKTAASALAAFWRARRFLGEFQPRVVHSHSFHSNIFARALKLLVPAPAVVSNIHNVNEGGRMRMLVYRLTDPLARRTVAISEAARQRFIALKAVSAGKSAVVPVAIDTSRFSPCSARRTRMRAEMGTAANADMEFIWLAVGRITPAKDYPNLLRAFAELRKQRADARLWIVGEAANAYAAELRVLGAELGLGDAVRWLGLRRDLPDLLDAADGFALSSAWEGMPQVIAEAMAMEKPVVATDVGGVRELMGDTGALVGAHNPGALAQAMLATMQQGGEEREQQVHAARERVVKHFSIESVTDAWEELYEQMTADGREQTVSSS